MVRIFTSVLLSLAIYTGISAQQNQNSVKDTLNMIPAEISDSGSTAQPPKATLVITTEPSEAIVILDDSLKSVSPATFTAVDSGSHQIQIRKKGFYLKRAEILIEKPDTLQLDFSLTQPGGLCIITDPSGLTTEITGIGEKITPFSVSQLKPGEYAVHIEKYPYATIDTTIAVLGGVVDTLSFKMEYGKAYQDSLRIAKEMEEKKYHLFSKIVVGGAFGLFAIVVLLVETFDK